jgi:hypothetical protein
MRFGPSVVSQAQINAAMKTGGANPGIFRGSYLYPYCVGYEAFK